jgi:hypothetical protein
MGRHWQTLRGRTKVEVYEKLRVILDAELPFWSIINPKNKKDAKKSMVLDPATKEWVLQVEFHK